MEYTTNYHLPQWVKEDRIQMEDFNQIMAILEDGLTAAQKKGDAAFSPEQMPWETGTLNLSSTEVGTVVKTFDFAPSVVFMWGSRTYVGVGFSGQTLYVTNTASGSSVSGSRSFRLDGNTLTQTGVENKATSYVYYLALR